MFCTECGSKIDSSQKFCGSCGTKIASTGEQQSSNSKAEFSHYAHAFNSLFQTSYTSIDDVTRHGQIHGDEIIKKSNSGDAEAALMVCIIYCVEEERYLIAHKAGNLALMRATKEGLDLGRFWFGYGFALEQAEMFDDAVSAHEKALELGFGEAAFNLGRLEMIHNLELGRAVKTWKIGRDKFNSTTCKEMLSDIEVDPGVYSANISNPDGSVELLRYSDNPGGLGRFK